MPRWKIALGQRALGLPVRRLVPQAQKIEAEGLELEATGDLAPGNLSQTGRRELRHLLQSYGLETAAMTCPLRRGLANPENQDARLEYLRQSLSLSYELGARVVAIEPGPLPTDEKDPAWPLVTEALVALGRHADRVGAVLALETGFEAGETVAKFLGRFDTGGLGVCFNPGNLLVHRHRPIEAATALAGRIVLVHAQDARATSASRSAQEVPLGHGDIDWLTMAGALVSIDYRGWLTVTRGGTMTFEEAKGSVRFLKSVFRGQ